MAPKKPALKKAVSKAEMAIIPDAYTVTPLFAEYLNLMGAIVPLADMPKDVFGPDDALLIIDMQADFLPVSAENPHGGKFGISEGDAIVQPIVQLIHAAVAAGASVCATRNYHPIDHISFATEGGPYPVHCVQGSEGAKFIKPISSALANGVRGVGSEKVFVAYKAMHENFHTPSALPYAERIPPFVDHGMGPLSRAGAARGAELPTAAPTGGPKAPWTGSLVLKQSNLMPMAGEVDMDAPPDVLATTADGVERQMKSLQTALAGKKRLFVCGLALDFGVLDTCLNAKAAGIADGLEVYMVLDAARAAHVPGIGSFGSGFLSDPAGLLARCSDAGVRMVSVRQLLGHPVLKRGASENHFGKAGKKFVQRVGAATLKHLEAEKPPLPKAFPHSLGPLGLNTVSLEVKYIHENSRNAHGTPVSEYEVTLDGPLKLLAGYGIDNIGTCSPPAPLPPLWPRAPPKAKQLVWADPIRGVAYLRQGESCGGGGSPPMPSRARTAPPNLAPAPDSPGGPPDVDRSASDARLTFLSLSTSAELCFAAYGGFLLLDAEGVVVSVQAIGAGETLQFGAPQRWPAMHEHLLHASGRLQPVTLPALQRAGATQFCWFNPNEAVPCAKGKNDPFVPSATGCFTYTRTDDDEPIFFELMERPREHVAFFTDVEGNWEYLLTFIERTEALTLIGLHPDGSMELELKEGWRVVFGGDSCDKGGVTGGTVRVVRTLVRLKKRYGERVTLILGNRDLNKMRLTSELADAAELSDARLDDVPGPYWVPPDKRVSPAMFVKKIAAAQQAGPPPPPDSGGGAVPPPTPPPLTADIIAKANTPWHRLCWMLKDTMGAAGEEERRRQELSRIEHDGGDVSDEQVVASFVESVGAGGFMREYLELGVLAAIIDGTLFVHGGVVGSGWAGGFTDCIGHVPGHSDKIDDVKEWVAALNEWKDAEVREWIEQPTWQSRPTSGERPGAPAAGRRGGMHLMNYCVDGSPPSVVGGRHLEKRGMPKPLDEPLCKRLKDGGVHRLLLGHTPHGNCPTIIRCGRIAPGSVGAFLIAMADTSYSEMKAPDNRGQACSTIDVMNDGRIRVEGVLPASVEAGASISYTVPADENELLYSLVGVVESENQPNGEPTPERRFVKARFGGERRDELLLCHVDGFKVVYSTMLDADARELLQVPRAPPPPPMRQQTLTSTGDEGFTGGEYDADDSRRSLSDHIHRYFQKLDADGDGQLTKAELQKALEDEPELLKLLAGTGRAPPTPDDLFASVAEDRDHLTSTDLVNFFVGPSSAPSGTTPPPSPPNEPRPWFAMAGRLLGVMLETLDSFVYRAVTWYFTNVRQKRLKDVGYNLIEVVAHRNQ